MTRDPTDKVPEDVLAAYGFAGAEQRPFERGVVNRHWLVTHEGRSCVIGRYHPARTAAAIVWAQALVRHAERANWPVPTPIPAVDGRDVVERGGRLWAAARFLEGVSVAEDSAASLNIRGRLLARLHRGIAGFEVERQRPDTGKTWELDLVVAPADAGSFNELLAAFGREYPELAWSIRRQRYRNLRELARLHYPDLPDYPIHGDFGRWNLLWKDGQLTGLVDFDQCRRDAQLCDLAPLFMPFMPLDPRLAAGLLEGYQSIRPLSDGEWELLPGLIRAALLHWVAFLLVTWRMTGETPAGIARTMNERFPAFEAAVPGWLALRSASARKV